MQNIFYINYEVDDFEIVKDINQLKIFFEEYFLKNTDKSKKIYVFIDEIQEVNSWEKFVNSLLVKYENNIEIFIS
jgi:predicted AAA+ superfamily ATPase